MYDDGLKYYEAALSERVALDVECHRLACVLLRNVGRNVEALRLAKQYAEGADILHLNTLASLLGDNGETDGAYAVLLEHVKRFIGVHHSQRPKGWHRATTTFLNICIEKGAPESGVDAAKILLGEYPDSVALYNCALIARNLSDRRESERIFDRINENVRESKNVQVHMAEAMLVEHQVSTEAAIEFLRERITRATTTLEKTPSDSKKAAIASDISRLTNLKSRMLFELEEYQECKTCLQETVTHDKFGDTSFLLARCCIALENEGDALAFLKAACSHKKKWRSLALRDELLNSSEAISKWLSDQAMRADDTTAESGADDVTVHGFEN